MTAYREGPTASGLPFARTRLGLFSALAIALSVFVLLGGIAAIVLAGGVRFLKEGGVGMYVILLFGAVSAAVLGALSPFVVRGKSVPAIVVSGAPVLPAVAGALFFSRGMQRAGGAVAGEVVTPDGVMRILAGGMAEANACLVLGCFVAAAACAAATAALLGSAATITPPAPVDPPSSPRLVAPMILGGIGVFAAIASRILTRSLVGSAGITVPFLIFVAILATVSASRAAMVRGWHDRHEANAWIAAVCAAAVLATAGVVLADLSALYAAERLGLSAVAAESLEPRQRVFVLAQVAREARAATIFATIDGVFAFAIAGSPLVHAIGRGPDRRVRAPLAATLYVALAAVFVSMLAVLGMRSAVLSSLTAKSEWLKWRTPQMDLPVIAETNGLEKGNESGPVVRIHDDGTLPAPPLFEEYQRNIVIEADRHVRWGAVEAAIHITIAGRMQETSAAGARSYARPPLPTVSIRFAPQPAPDLAPLGGYAMFLQGTPGPSTILSLEGAVETVAGDTKRVAIEQSDDMQTVIDKLAAARYGYDSSRGPRLVVRATAGPRW